MRKTAKGSGVTVCGYAGSTGILLAMNVDDGNEKGLLGFAISRKEGNAAPQFLPGMLNFPGIPKTPGQLIGSDTAPIQKFRWSDYAVHSDTEYVYSVHPVYGQPGNLDIRQGPEIKLKTGSIDLASLAGTTDAHLVLFNRAVGASQAFARKFATQDDKLTAAKTSGKKMPAKLSDDAMTWLGRGVPEMIVDFVGLAKDSSHAIDVAIYQYELPMIVDAINAAFDRGVNVRLIYHAKPGDTQTTKNVASAKHLPKGNKVGRVTTSIFHHKFIVLSKLDGETREPIAALGGSTNFTFNGVYCQANDVHVTSDAAIATKYLEQFEFIFAGNDVVTTRKHDTEQNVLDPADALQVGFSPRTAEKDLDFFVTLINSAKRDVLFSTAFNMSDKINEALGGQAHDPILRYGIQDKSSKSKFLISGVHADRSAEFEAAATLPKGLEGWLEEKRVPGQTGNILIHTKVIVVDFSSDTPITITGSHNYSHNASAGNDENYLIFRGNTDMADSYGIEVMRIYDHYRFRFVETQQAKKSKLKPPTLTPDDSWTKDYFDPTKLKYADRLRFSGQTGTQAKGAKAVAGRISPLPKVEAKPAPKKAKPAAKKSPAKRK